MAVVGFSFFGFLAALLAMFVWAALDMMFGIGFSNEAAQGLLLLGASVGGILGAVLFIFFG